ncbi:MAG: peptidoglycan-binding protein [Pseudomonadota bacterium]
MERRVSAILAADMVGFSRLTEIDEAGTISRQKRYRIDVVEPLTEKRNGNFIKFTGDGWIAEYPSVVEAVQCAVEIQEELQAREAEQTPSLSICYRMAINLGDVIFDEGDVYGDGVNIAARLEPLADPGGLIISGTAYDLLKNQVEVSYRSLGQKRLKNIATPVRAYAVSTAIDSDRRPRPRFNLMASKKHLAGSFVVFVLAASIFVWLTNFSTKASYEELLSEIVSKSQQELANLGLFDGLPSGEVDFATRSAVLKFQRENGIPATGILTPKTVEALGLENPLDGELSSAELIAEKFAKQISPDGLALAGFSSNLVRIAKVFERSKLTFGVFEDSLYIAVQVRALRSWNEIAKISDQLNGHIVSITSPEENQFVFEMISEDPAFWHPGDLKLTWIGPAIGLHQKDGAREPDQGWVWQSGEDVEYSNWLASQPNDWNNEEHIAVFMNIPGAISEGSPPKVSDQWGDFWVNANAFVLEFENFELMEKPLN